MIRRARMLPSDQEVRNTIAGNVQYFLEVRGLSRRDLAKRTGDPVASVARVAAGSHTCGTGLVVRIADALGVTLDRLLLPPQ